MQCVQKCRLNFVRYFCRKLALVIVTRKDKYIIIEITNDRRESVERSFNHGIN